MALASRQKRHRQGGFTLLEMLISMSVLVILATLGVPSFVAYTATQDTKRGAQTLYSSLLTARSEALKRNASVYVHANGGTADNWGDGWIITTNAALDAVDCNAAAQLPGVIRAFCRDDADRVDFVAGVKQVVYRPDGRASVARIQICHDKATARTVRVGTAGLPYMYTGGDCP